MYAALTGSSQSICYRWRSCWKWPSFECVGLCWMAFYAVFHLDGETRSCYGMPWHNLRTQSTWYERPGAFNGGNLSRGRGGSDRGCCQNIKSGTTNILATSLSPLLIMLRRRDQELWERAVGLRRANASPSLNAPCKGRGAINSRNRTNVRAGQCTWPTAPHVSDSPSPLSSRLRNKN